MFIYSSYFAPLRHFIYYSVRVYSLFYFKYCLFCVYIENTSWKVLAYGIYARVVDVSEIERVSAANE